MLQILIFLGEIGLVNFGAVFIKNVAILPRIVGIVVRFLYLQFFQV